MKRLTMLGGVLCGVLFLCLPVICQAEGRPYFSAQAGAAFLEDQDAGIADEVGFDPGVFGAVALGYDFGERYSHFRVEGELAYRQNHIDDITIFGETRGARGDIRVGSFLFNGYYQVDNPSFLKPFVMAGVGLAWLQVDDAKALGMVIVDDDDLQVCGQAGAGLSLQFTPVFALDLGYKYFWTARAQFEDETGGSASADYEAHNAYAGLRFSF